MYVRCHIFSFTKSRSLKIRYHVPSTVGPEKESLTSTLGSQQLDRQLDHVAALGSSFISCTTLGVRTPVTLIAEFPWVITPGACLGKLFLVINTLRGMLKTTKCVFAGKSINAFI